MPSILDFGYIILFAVVLALFEHFVWFPRFRADVSAGVQGARVRAYRRAIAGQWLVTLGAAAIWIAHDRTTVDLRLTPPSGWRLAVSIVVAGIAIGFAAMQILSVKRAQPSDLAAARPKLKMYELILPHTLSERRWFLALSLTAGVCEEFLYRGYFAWVLHWWLGWTGAVAVGVALFGVAHAYQGRSGATRATLAGAFMGAVFLTTHWLVPAMIAHALVDVGSGMVGYEIFKSGVPESGDASTATSVA